MSDKKKETLRAVKFVLFSISAGLIQAVSIWLLETFTRFPSWLCYLIGLVLHSKQEIYFQVCRERSGSDAQGRCVLRRLRSVIYARS